MPSGDDIGYALKRLRIAAVDAFMLGPGTPERRMRWNSQDNGLGEDFYTEGDVSWTCPNSDGYNGGQSVGIIDAKDYSGDFFRIYDRISGSTTRWKSIPDSTKIGDLRSRSDPLVKSFEPCLGGGPKGTYQGIGSLFSNIERLNGLLRGADHNANGKSDVDEGLQGTAVLLFKEYFGDLMKAVLACQQVVRVLDGAVAAEEQLWGAVRYDVPQSIHRLAGACKGIAGGGSARVDLDGVLNGAALGLGVASVVISGPVGVTIGIVSLGLSVVTMSGVTGTEGFDPIEYLNPQPAPPRTCDGALDVLEEMLNGSSRSIDENITSVERKIADTLDAAIDKMESRRSAFDPIAERISSVTVETLRYDQAIVDRVNESMGYIADELSAIVTRVRDCRDALPGSTLRSRNGNIGVDPYGRLDRLLELLETNLTEIAAEAAAGAAYFRAAMESYAQTDAATQARLQQLAQEFMDADTSGLGSDGTVSSVSPRRAREVAEQLPLVIPDLWRMHGPGWRG